MRKPATDTNIYSIQNTRAYVADGDIELLHLMNEVFAPPAFMNYSERLAVEAFIQVTSPEDPGQPIRGKRLLRILRRSYPAPGRQVDVRKLTQDVIELLLLAANRSPVPVQSIAQ